MSELLSGYRVLESSMLLNGASTGMILADLGADVIKVESPFLGDYIRLPYTRHLHVQANRNKRSVALDLRTDAGQEVFDRLLVTADVFVTNAVADRNDRLEIGYQQLRSRKPDLIYCQNTGFGATGPYRSLPVHGQMMDALAGGLPVEMGPDGLTRPELPPQGRSGSMMMGGEGTSAGAVFAALHVAAALAHRAITGEGCYIDVSSAAAVVASAWTSASALLNAPPERATMLSDPGVARYQFYQARDGHFLLFCPEETKFWVPFCEAVGRPDLRERESGVELRRELQELFSTRDRATWMALALDLGLPIGPANRTIDEVFSDPQLAARGVFREGVDPSGRPFVFVEQPALVDGKPPAGIRPAPELGQHTGEILGELGYSPEEQAQLARDRVTVAVQEEAPIPAALSDP